MRKVLLLEYKTSHDPRVVNVVQVFAKTSSQTT